LTEEEQQSIIKKFFDKAISGVGLITILITIAVYGAAASAFGVITGAYIAFFAFGFVGCLEIFNRQKNFLAQQRCKDNKINNLFEATLSAKKTWHPKIIDEVKHNEIIFRAVGFEEVGIPFGISSPLCQKCHDKVIQRVHVKFPGRIKIQIICRCGFEISSKYTLQELEAEAAQLLKIPK
jgi:hypothetical protein